MSEKLEQLKNLLKRKQSEVYYASVLGISVEEVKELKKKLKEEKDVDEYIDGVMEHYEKYSNTFEGVFEQRQQKVNNDKGTLESSVETTYEPKDDLELASLHKIDLTKYKISSYWSKLKSNGKFTSSVFATLIKVDSVEKFQGDFKEFLEDFQYNPQIIKFAQDVIKPKISLILPKQDAHFNKFDIGGDNDIDLRFNKSKTSVLNMLLKASSTNYIEEVVYIIGSDQFNSEWTSMTTKGTLQQNILSHQEGFKAICKHEVDVISTLASHSEKVKVVFLPGNHDEFVGWHLIDWLESYFRTILNIEFDSKLENTKYHKYNNSAVMLNHGDDIKPVDLAAKFPIGFKQEWSYCDNFYIFTGDKHHEMSKDFNGIKFYQVPQLSSAKSKWDDKKGFTVSKPEMTAFVITENNGMSDVYKDLL